MVVEVVLPQMWDGGEANLQCLLELHPAGDDYRLVEGVAVLLCGFETQREPRL
jgi:hypothetical protein